MVKKVHTPKTKPRFGDARDAYIKSLNSTNPCPMPNPCTSKGLSTMPRRQK